ncbi:MAG: PH domain-containing protein [Propionibacteriaceae bacterium]|nr:PH domain-containing protein [Propionibacteriaceae bacterium]
MHLAEGERVLVNTHRSAGQLAAPAVCLIVLAGLAGAGIGLLPKRWEPYATWALWVVVGAVCVVSVMIPIIKWQLATCVITNKRILTRTGVFSVVRHDVPLTHVELVAHARSLRDRALGQGVLLLTLTSGQVVRIPDLPRIVWLHSLLSELIWAYGPRKPDYTDGRVRARPEATLEETKLWPQ